MSSVVFLVAQQGCKIKILSIGRGRKGPPCLVPVGKAGSELADQPGARTLKVGTIDVQPGTYRVTDSSAFRLVKGGDIIVYDAEDPTIPVPSLAPGFASTQDLVDALYRYVGRSSK